MYKLCVLMLDIFQGCANSYLVDLCNTYSDDRSASRGDVVNRTNTKLANKAFCVAGPSAWNSLPSHTRTIDTKNRFSKQLQSDTQPLSIGGVAPYKIMI